MVMSLLSLRGQGGQAPWSIKIAQAPDGDRLRRRGFLSFRESTFQIGHATNQLARGPLGLDNLALDVLAALRAVRVGSLGLSFEANQQVAKVFLEAIDVILEPRERPLNLLDG